MLAAPCLCVGTPRRGLDLAWRPGESVGYRTRAPTAENFGDPKFQRQLEGRGQVKPQDQRTHSPGRGTEQDRPLQGLQGNIEEREDGDKQDPAGTAAGKEVMRPRRRRRGHRDQIPKDSFCRRWVAFSGPVPRVKTQPLPQPLSQPALSWPPKLKSQLPLVRSCWRVL